MFKGFLGVAEVNLATQQDCIYCIFNKLFLYLNVQEVRSKRGILFFFDLLDGGAQAHHKTWWAGLRHQLWGRPYCLTSKSHLSSNALTAEREWNPSSQVPGSAGKPASWGVEDVPCSTLPAHAFRRCSCFSLFDIWGTMWNTRTSLQSVESVSRQFGCNEFICNCSLWT